MLVLLSAVAATAVAPFPGCHGGTLEGCPGTQNCTVHYLEQNIDHFNWAAPLGAGSTTFSQRFFVNKQWWKGAGAPVFFYFGNEDNVELYVNHTGLMWESAAAFGALLVFAEHRYYGQSLLYAPGSPGCMNFLTTEQVRPPPRATRVRARLCRQLVRELRRGCVDQPVAALTRLQPTLLRRWRTSPT